MEKDKNTNKTKEYHYSYNADSKNSSTSNLSKNNRELLDIVGKMALSGPIIMSAIFFGSMFIISWLLIGGFTMILGTGSLLFMGLSVYLLVNGVQQILASTVTGIGVCGFGLFSLACSALFAFATVYSVHKVIPEIIIYYRTLRTWITGKKEVKQ